jgi:hypothetical protein
MNVAYEMKEYSNACEDVQGRASRDVLLVVDGRAFTAARKKKGEKKVKQSEGKKTCPSSLHRRSLGGSWPRLDEEKKRGKKNFGPLAAASDEGLKRQPSESIQP